MANYASVYGNAFPPSATVYSDAAGKMRVDGYSFLVKHLPFMEYNFMYKSLPQLPNGELDVAASSDPNLIRTMNTSIKEWICPSNPNKNFQNSAVNPPQFALTNYKTIGASTRNSLLMAADPIATPPYGTAERHPFLTYDFRPGGADAGTYEDLGWAKAPPVYGPSSAHPLIVVVGFADGSVAALSKRVDAANLFFLITKDNSDPFNMP